MMTMTALELRKNRLVFIGLAASFALSLPLGAWMGARSLPSSIAGVHAVLAFWCALGLPGAALLLGCAAGAGLRAQPALEAESLLPVSPRGRLAAAASSAFLHTALLSALVLAAAVLLGPWVGMEEYWGRMSRDTLEFLGLYSRLLAFTLAFILGAALLLAGLFGHGILGGLLASALGAGAAAAVGAGMTLRLFFPHSVGWDYGLEAASAASLLLLWGALASAAPALERRPRRAWAALSLSGLLAVLAAALCAGALGLMWRGASRARVLLEPAYLGDWGAEAPTGPHARAALVADRDGALASVGPDGREEVLLPGERRPLRNLLDWPFWFPNRCVAWTPDGSQWALRRAPGGPGGWELYRRRPGESARRVFALAGEWTDLELDWREGALVLAGGTLSSGGKWSYRYAKVPAEGGSPRWKPAPLSRRPALAQPRLARLNAELRRLAARSGEEDPAARPLAPLNWRSPRGALYTALLEDGARVLLERRKDGTLRRHWRGRLREDFRPWTLPDGTNWSWGKGEELLILDPEGAPLAPVPLGKALAQARAGRGAGLWRKPRLIHREPGRLWLLAGSALLLVAEDGGALLKRVDLRWRRRDWRDDRSGFHVSEEGLFHHDGRALHFMDWEGRLRRLGRA